MRWNGPTNISSHDTASQAIKIYEPVALYNALDPCVRWVLNVCSAGADTRLKFGGDNAQNCHPRNSKANYTGEYSGLGAQLKCTDAACVCRLPNWFDSLQTLFDRADHYCEISIPTRDGKPNELFKQTIQFLTSYCSTAKGFVLDEWSISKRGTVDDGSMCFSFASSPSEMETPR